ncbi:MAG TPA: DUF441 domain-containing protein [Clostridiales bacterium]|nr:DUF441 domain-containing protein [Clostridiales bacterium]
MESTVVLVAILAVAVLGKADAVAVAACILLLLKLLHIDNYVFPAIEKSGMFLGLILLIAAILIPIASGNITAMNIKNVFTSWVGVAALILSFFTTYLSGLGVRYLTVQNHADVMPALILGAVAAASFLGGVPVGPFITSGMLALVIKVFHHS